MNNSFVGGTNSNFVNTYDKINLNSQVQQHPHGNESSVQDDIRKVLDLASNLINSSDLNASSVEMNSAISASLREVLDKSKTSLGEHENFLSQIHLTFLKKEDSDVSKKIQDLNKELSEISFSDDVSHDSLEKTTLDFKDALEKCNLTLSAIQEVVSQIAATESSAQTNCEDLKEKILEFSKRKNDVTEEEKNKIKALMKTVNLNGETLNSFIESRDELILEYNNQVNACNDLNNKIVEQKKCIKNNIDYIRIKSDLRIMFSIKNALNELKDGDDFSLETISKAYPRLNAATFFETLLYNLDDNMDHPMFVKIASELKILRLFVCHEKNKGIDLLKIKNEVEKNPGIYKNLNIFIEKGLVNFIDDANFESKSCFDYAPTNGNSCYPSIISNYMAYADAREGGGSGNSFLKNILDEADYALFEKFNGNEYIFAKVDKDLLIKNNAKSNRKNQYNFYIDNIITDDWMNIGYDDNKLNSINNPNIKYISKQIVTQMNEYYSFILGDSRFRDLMDNLSNGASQKGATNLLSDLPVSLGYMSSLLEPLDCIVGKLHEELGEDITENPGTLNAIINYFSDDEVSDDEVSDDDEGNKLTFLILLLRAQLKKDEANSNSSVSSYTKKIIECFYPDDKSKIYGDNFNFHMYIYSKVMNCTSQGISIINRNSFNKVSLIDYLSFALNRHLLLTSSNDDGEE